MVVLHVYPLNILGFCLCDVEDLILLILTIGQYMSRVQLIPIKYHLEMFYLKNRVHYLALKIITIMLIMLFHKPNSVSHTRLFCQQSNLFEN